MTAAIPSGITGLTNAQSDPAAFRRFAHATARQIHASVTTIETPHVCSFDVLCLNSDQEPPLWLLHNRWLPLLAASKSIPTFGQAFAANADFVALPTAENPAHHALRALTPEYLTENLGPHHLVSLSNAELDHAKYFEPTQVAHFIYNYWD